MKLKVDLYKFTHLCDIQQDKKRDIIRKVIFSIQKYSNCVLSLFKLCLVAFFNSHI